MALALYVGIYVLLLLATWLELWIIGLKLAPSAMVTSIVGLAGGKAILIALFYQHLKYESRSVSGLALLGLVGAMTFMLISMLSMAGLHVVQG